MAKKLESVAGAKSEIGLFLTITVNGKGVELQFDYHKYYDNCVKIIVPSKYRKRYTDLDRVKNRQVVTYSIHKAFAKRLIKLGLKKFTSVWLIKYKRNSKGNLEFYSYNLKTGELLDGPDHAFIHN